MADGGAKVRMYGAMWCKDCRRSKALLDRRGTAYENIDLTEYPERAEEAQAISGRPNIPVIVFDDGLVLVEPSDDELGAALDARI